MTTHKLTNSDVRTLLAVGLAASKDQARPILCAVEVRVFDVGMRVTATDSYVLATGTLGMDIDALNVSDLDSAPVSTFLLPYADIVPILKGALKRTADAITTIDHDETGGLVTVSNGGSSVTVDATFGEFPNWRQLVAKDDDMAGLGRDDIGRPITVGLAAAKLCQVAKIAEMATDDKNACIRWAFNGPLKAAQWHVHGSTVRGLSMPVR